MLRPVAEHDLMQFRAIYHQTMPHTNTIIESVLYGLRPGHMYYWGDLLDGNYFICHSSGFAHLNANPNVGNLDSAVWEPIDEFLKVTPDLPPHLMFYHVPPSLLALWQRQDRPTMRVRARRRYELDVEHILSIDPQTYAPPAGHVLVPVVDCSIDDVASFGVAPTSRFYGSEKDFRRNTFGFVLYTPEGRPASLAYGLPLIGRTSESDLVTSPEFRGRGYGYITVTQYVRESIRRKIVVGWDCFVDAHTARWAHDRYGYTAFREYDFVTFTR